MVPIDLESTRSEHHPLDPHPAPRKREIHGWRIPSTWTFTSTNPHSSSPEIEASWRGVEDVV